MVQQMDDLLDGGPGFLEVHGGWVRLGAHEGF